MTKFEKQVVSVAIVGSLTWATVMVAQKAYNAFTDNFLYLPSVNTCEVGQTGVTLITERGEAYYIEVEGNVK